MTNLINTNLAAIGSALFARVTGKRYMGSKSYAFGGEPLRFARNLANFALAELIGAKATGVPFGVMHDDGVPCLILPMVPYTGEKLKIIVFYDPKGRLSLRTLFSENEYHLLAQWRKYCRAFVIAQIDPLTDHGPVVLDHGATRNAASSLGKPYNGVAAPDMLALDAALGTKLKYVHEERWSKLAAFDGH